MSDFIYEALRQYTPLAGALGVHGMQHNNRSPNSA